MFSELRVGPKMIKVGGNMSLKLTSFFFFFLKEKGDRSDIDRENLCQVSKA